MAFDRIAYDALQTTMARQRVTVYDLYGLLGVSPNVDDDGLRDAYDSITKKLKQVPSDAINSAYSVLANPFKRAQYDRDRLEYLYRHFSDHESFPPTSSIPSTHLKTRDDQIQVYATTLVDRVKDPTEDKKRALSRRLETIRNELDEFNELSGRQRQDWATSGNRVLRMAGNALCEVVVCAEEDLRMLEDELGRIDGTLAPRDLDGPAGRVTSNGYYGSEIMAMPTGTTPTTAMMMMPPQSSQPRVLMGKCDPSLPRSPTVQFLPQSASKLGVDGGVTKDTPSSEGSQDPSKADGKDRVNDFLLGATHARLQNGHGHAETTNAAAAVKIHTQPRLMRSRASTLMDRLRQAAAQEHFDAGLPTVSTTMGLVDWQRLNGPRIPDDSPRGNTDNNDKNTGDHDNNNTNKPPADLSAWAKAYDPTHTQSADALLRRQHQLDDAPAPPAGAWRNSWDPAYSRSPGAAAAAAIAAGGGFGFHVAQPATRQQQQQQLQGVVPATSSATASNTVLFKEVQDRAAALARAPGRWVVGGPGLTNYGAGRVVSADAVQDGKKGAKDPFV
ncbi:hypothetical protein diail_3845 [Diaporthe ilicicola]|nr:hypothetical protein diail_3845 [Diaporthe ilicicola]